MRRNGLGNAASFLAPDFIFGYPNSGVLRPQLLVKVRNPYSHRSGRDG
jgi:hypothetical protein